MERAITRKRASRRLPDAHTPRVRGVALCPNVRENAPVVTAGISTSDFPMDARILLGQEVKSARLAAGIRSRAALAKLAGVSTKAIGNLEAPVKAPPTGFAVLVAVARVLPGWTDDTPREILKGGKAPDARHLTEQPTSAVAIYAALEEAGWSAEDEERFQTWKRVLGLDGLKLTLERYLAMKHDAELDDRRKQPTSVDDGK